MAGNASKMAIVWAAVRDSLWFIPAVITALGAALAFASIWIDRRFAPGADAQGLWYVFGAGADGARGVLRAGAFPRHQ